MSWSTTTPWYRFLHWARNRCRYPSSKMYHRYGGRGIKCLLTHQEVKILWERDKASKLKRPSLDRIDPDKNYEFENCRFIELEENIRKGGGLK